MSSWVGDPMGRAWQYVLSYPGCSKRSAALAAVPGDSLSYGYRVVDRALALGLIDSRRKADGSYCLMARPLADLPINAARALMAWYTRRGERAPAALVDRLAEPAGKTA